MDQTLQTTLRAMLARGTEPNDVLELLIRDYQRFHLVLVIVGGVFLVLVLGLGAVLWRGWGRARSQGDAARRFERRAYGVGAVLATGVALLLAVVVVANVSTVLSPRQGFAGSLGMLGSPAQGSRSAVVQHEVSTWLESSNPVAVPPELQQRVDARLSWQRPKAVVTSVLLVVVSVLGLLAWRRLVRRARASGGRSTRREVPLLLGAWAAAFASFVLMLMVMGNTQGSLAPLSLTLFLG